MKKIVLNIMAPVAIILMMLACNSSSKDGYLLKMRLAKGDKFSNNILMDMQVTTTVMGMSQEVKMKMDMGSDFEVLDSNASGKLLKMTYTRMKMGMNMANNPGIDMDSIMNAATAGIIGKSITITLKDNKVVDVTGMDSILTQAHDSSSRMMIEKMVEKENLNQTFGMMFNIYPEKPVKVGDSWEKENEFQASMMKMKVKTTYTLAGVKDGIAELTINGKIDSKGSMNQGNMEMTMDMKGTQKGRMGVKTESGYIDKGNYDMDVDANMEMMGQKVPMKLLAKYSISGQ
ncbi:MAG: DUF6263 family protein [Ferruginibacter sp.]